MVETRAGTVWAATDQGLAWFDGVQWFAMSAAQGIPPVRATSIQPIGDDQVLVHLRGDGVLLGDRIGFQRLTLPEGAAGDLVRDVYVGQGDAIWVLQRHQAGGLRVREAGTWRTVDPPPEVQPTGVARLIGGEVGVPWLGTDQGNYRWSNGEWEQMLESDPIRVSLSSLWENAAEQGLGVRRHFGRASDLFEWEANGPLRQVLRISDPQLTTVALRDTGEAVVISANGQALVRSDGVWGEVSPLPNQWRSALHAYYGAAGDLWVGSRDGLQRFRRGAGRWAYWRHGEEQQWNEVLEVCPSREGSVWIGTTGGLLIHRVDGSYEHVERIDEQPLRVVTAVAQDGAGNVWVGSGSAFRGVYQWDGETWRHFGPAEGLIAPYIHKIRIDRAGRPWFLGLGEYPGADAEEPGAFVFEDGRFQRWGLEEGLPSGRVYGFAESSTGDYWFATAGGLSRWDGSGWRHWDTSDGMVTDRVFALAIDRQDRVWFGDQSHGLGCLEPEGPIRYQTTADGLPSNRVWDLWLGPQGRLWIATAGGVACHDGDSWSMFTAANGLSNPLVMCVRPEAGRVLVGTYGAGVAVMNLEPNLGVAPPRLVIHDPAITADGLRIGWDVYTDQGDCRKVAIESRYRLDGGAWSGWTASRGAVFRDIDYGRHELEIAVRGPGGFLETTSEVQTFRHRRPLLHRPSVAVPLLVAFLSLAAFTGVQMDRRRRAREALRSTERRYQRLAELASSYLYVASIDAEANVRLEWAGQGFEKTYGCTAAEYRERGGWRAMVHPDEIETTAERHRRLLAGESTQVETRIVRPDGAVRWLHIASRPERDERSGRVVRVTGSVRDITTEKEAQAALQESERRLTTLLSNLPGMAYRCLADRDWTMLLVSENAEELTGYTPEQLQDSRRITYAELIHPDDRAMVERLVYEGLEKSSKFELNYRIQTAGGEEKWVWERGRAVTAPGVEPAVLEGFIEDITERRRVEEAERSSEEYFRAFFEQAPAGLGVTSRDGRILAWNPTVLEMLRLTAEQASNMKAHELYANPEERRAVLETFEREGEVRNWETQFRRGDGTLVWLALTLVPIHWRGMDLLLATMIDIDERRRAEETVRRSEAQFRTLFERLPVGIGLASAEGQGGILTCNQAVLDMLGYELSEVEGHQVGSFYVDPAEAQMLFERYCQEGHVEGHEVGLRAADGSTVWVSLTMVPFDWDGTDVILSTLVDVNTRREAEEQSRQSQERLLRAEEVARIGNWEWDVRTDAVKWSEGMYRVTGIDPAETPVTAHLIREQIMHPDYREAWQQAVEVACETGGRLNVEVQCLRQDGELYWLHHEAEVVKDESGELVQMFGIAQDVTDRKQAEELRRRTEQRLELTLESARIGTWIHDFRTDAVERDERTTAMLGYAPGELPGTADAWRAIVHPDDLLTVKEATRAHVAGETPVFRVEHRLRTRQGDWKWVLNTGRVVERDAEGRAIRALGIHIDIDEQKGVEQRLRESEGKMKSIFRAAPIGLGVVADRVLLDVNERLCELTGYSKEELLGQSARMLYPSQADFEYVGEEKYRQIAEGGTGTVETRFLRKDGAIIDVLLSSTPFDASDLIRGVTFTALDITERNRAAAELAAIQGMLEAAIAQSPAGIVIADAPDGAIRVVNPAALSILGYDPETITGTDMGRYAAMWTTCRADGTPYPAEELPLSRAVMRGEVCQGEEFYILDQQGRKRWVIGNAAPIRDSEGSIVAGIVIFPEITERRRAEEALRASEERLRNIVEHSTNLFYSHTTDHELTYVSPQSVEILGCPPEEALVRWTEFATNHTVNERGFAMTQRAIETGERQEPFELQLRTRDGRIVWVEVHEAPVVVGGRTIAIVGALTDITERHATIEQLQRQAELERLLRRELDHRVRNNLTSLVALIDLGAQSTTDVEKLAASLRSRVNAMAAVHSLLSEEQWRPVDLKTILQRALTAEDSTQCSLQGPVVSVAPDRIQPLIMVINELATNSRKYGALSVPGGQMSLIWSLEQAGVDERLRLTWSEEGGPAIVGEPALGVGLQLVKGLIERELGGGVQWNFAPQGVRHSLWIQYER
ncbi:MAG: PAS domain S-box protein [Phycisphaerales bacterium JB038]